MSSKRIVLTEYFTTEKEVLIFGIRDDWEEPIIVSLPLDQIELRRFVLTNFGGSNHVRDLVGMGLEELWHGYDRLIEPIAQWTNPEDIVYLVPHGLLHYLPLHALKIGSQYFIERNPVAYSPSASVLKYCQAKRKTNPSGTPARQTVAIFGDSQNNLPDARAEAEELAKLFGVIPLLGNSATRDAFLEYIEGVDIIHFAGHGNFNPLQALESGLKLAGDRMLTAREVFSLQKLHANLVTLSGCETGVNENHPGDELLGLTRAFLYAGASSLIVSLWRVADNSTAFLMKQFYTTLLENPTMFKVEALRQAMIATKAQSRWSSFYHWAPYELVGDYL